MMTCLFRKRWGFALILALMLADGPARAETHPLNLDLAQDHVNITAGFTGSTLSIFGTRQGWGDIVVVLEGRSGDSIVRRRENVAGAWVNRSWLKFKDIPVYYDFANSRPSEKGLLPAKELYSNHIGLDSFKLKMENNQYDAESTKEFQNALIRNRQDRSLFPLQQQKVSFIDDNFFRVDFHLPSNVPHGEYTVRAMLIRDGKIVHEIERSMTVAQIGFSSNVYWLAHDHSLLYGVLCVFVACVAGWLSNVLVRRN